MSKNPNEFFNTLISETERMPDFEIAIHFFEAYKLNRDKYKEFVYLLEQSILDFEIQLQNAGVIRKPNVLYLDKTNFDLRQTRRVEFLKSGFKEFLELAKSNLVELLIKKGSKKESQLSNKAKVLVLNQLEIFDLPQFHPDKMTQENLGTLWSELCDISFDNIKDYISFRNIRSKDKKSPFTDPAIKSANALLKQIGLKEIEEK